MSALRGEPSAFQMKIGDSWILLNAAGQVTGAEFGDTDGDLARRIYERLRDTDPGRWGNRRFVLAKDRDV